jgi:hypothetical protein
LFVEAVAPFDQKKRRMMVGVGRTMRTMYPTSVASVALLGAPLVPLALLSLLKEQTHELVRMPAWAGE